MENDITHLSRTLDSDYFTKDGLTMLIGCESEKWHITILKELIDNALDASEQGV
jgi:DNA topoisomerase VI subunit B